MLLISSAVWVGLAVATHPAGPPVPAGDSTAAVLHAAWTAVQHHALVIGLLSLTALGAAAYMVNYFAFCQDVAPAHTGLVIGYLGGLGNLFAAGFLPLAGWISQGPWGSGLNFVIVGTLPLLGLLALLAGWGRDAE